MRQIFQTKLLCLFLLCASHLAVAQNNDDGVPNDVAAPLEKITLQPGEPVKLLPPAGAFDVLKNVNPFIGTGGHGHTFPGACAPFGMVQLSPDTRLDPGDWDGCGGYHFDDSKIYGFSHTHLSGTGVPDYCDILFMPFTGKMELDPKEYGSKFSHKKEQAEAGFYSVFLEKDGILAELTATTRAGIHRYTYPKNRENAHLLIDLRHRDMTLDAHFEKISDTEIAGWRSSRSWAKEQRIFFFARFSKPISNTKFLDMAVDPKTTHPEVTSREALAVLTFKNDGEPLVVAVGISAVSIEGARKNLSEEIQDFDFQRIKNETQAEWATELNKVEVEGGTAAQRTAFYTALYHSYIQPNIFSDVDGQYRGRDQKIHTAKGSPQYTVFSLWDTYRAANPLYTLLEPRRVGDFVNTFLRQSEEGGLLPIWELCGNETDCMIGNHALPVIADAWLKGIRSFDGKAALAAMLRSANQDRLGLDWYRKLGYIPSDKEPESVSKTLEYAFDDWAISLIAKDLGQNEVGDLFARRAQNYRNLFDPASKFFRAKNNSTWHQPFDPFEVNFNYTEANAWQYRFAAPQDVSGMVKLHGGREKFALALDSLFSAKTATSGRQQADITGQIGQYVQGNEPSHHMAYLYNYVGQPAKTATRVHEIMTGLYSDQPDGLAGNEDCGQMSAWLVFSAMGFYPAVPVGGEYALGTPLFDKIRLHLDGNKSFIINAKRTTPGSIFIQKAQLNGANWPNSWLRHEHLTGGGQLDLALGERPSDWGTDCSMGHCPVSEIALEPAPAIPFVAAGERVFRKKQDIALGCADAEAAIFYTLDGSVPSSKSTRYDKSFAVKGNTHLAAIAIRGSQTSAVMEADFSEMKSGVAVLRYNTKFNDQYTGRGENGLVDQLRGGNDFRSGGWQGFEGVNLDLVLDLGKKRAVSRVVGGFLQDENSWIFFPSAFRVEVSDDGQNFRPAGEVATQISPEKQGSQLQDFVVKLPGGTKARYLRVVGVSLGKCPATHKGAGNACWLFADEILVE